MLIDNTLVENLLRRGVPFLSGGDPAAPDLADDKLLACLASSSDARVRTTVIPHLLARPAAGAAIEPALARCDHRARLTLACFYTAATWLQRMHEATLRGLCQTWIPLPHVYDRTLGIDADAPRAALRQLAARQASSDPTGVNWFATYQHAPDRIIRSLSQEQVWQRA